MSGDRLLDFLRQAKRKVTKIYPFFRRALLIDWALTSLRLAVRMQTTDRRLEIGPGQRRIPGFETLSIVSGKSVDYVLDASKRLPFRDDTFNVIYASHVLEHIPWYWTEHVLREWFRILRSGGVLEIWVPDAMKVCSVLMDAELNGGNLTHLDGWYKFNPDRNPFVWAAGRLFTYGEGDGSLNSPNWHRAMFTPKYLEKLFENVGLKDVRRLSSQDVRGDDHGWINLGIAGTKLYGS